MGGLGFGRFAYPILLPEMARALSLSRLQSGMLYSANLAGYLLFTLVGGLLAVRSRAKPVIVASLFVGGAALILTGFSSSFAWALVWRFLTGLGNGGAFVPMLALVAVWFRPRRRGMAAGAMHLGVGLSVLTVGALIPPLMGLAKGDGWRLGWFALGGVAIAVGVLLAFLLHDRPDDGPPPVSLPGRRMAHAGDSQPRSSGEPEPGDRVAPMPSPSQARSGLGENPHGAWGELLRSFNLWHLAVIHFSFGFTNSVYATFFSEYLITAQRLTLAAAGSMWAAHGLASAASSFVWGMLSDYLGRKYTLALNFCFFLAAALLFLSGSALPTFYLSALLFGSVAASPPAIMAAASGDYFGPRMAAGAFTVVTLFSATGQILGPALGGFAADATASLGAPYWLSSMGAALGLAASLLLARPPRGPLAGRLPRRDRPPRAQKRG